MIRKYLKLTLLSVLALYLPSCGHDQQLVSIEIQPSTETFGAANIPVSADQGASVQLRALGHYIHPPVTKDITNQATWSSNTPGMVAVNSTTGLITATGAACGGTLISATVTTNHSVGNIGSTGAIVTAFMTANVVCFTASGSGGPLLTANFAGAGAGTITSSPPGLSCASTCTATFPSGTTVTLTATPIGTSTFGGWANCDSVSGSGMVCTVDNLTTDRGVTVTFN